MSDLTTLSIRLEPKVKEWLYKRADELGKSPSELMRGVVKYVSGVQIDELRELFKQAEYMQQQTTKLREMQQMQYDAYREMSADAAFKAGFKKTPEPGFERG